MGIPEREDDALCPVAAQFGVPRGQHGNPGRALILPVVDRLVPTHPWGAPSLSCPRRIPSNFGLLQQPLKDVLSPQDNTSEPGNQDVASKPVGEITALRGLDLWLFAKTATMVSGKRSTVLSGAPIHRLGGESFPAGGKQKKGPGPQQPRTLFQRPAGAAGRAEAVGGCASTLRPVHCTGWPP